MVQIKRYLLHVLILFLIFNGFAYSEEKGPEKILIIPFSINSETDLSFLQNGINKMCMSRLAFDKKVEPVLLEEKPDKELTDTEAIALGKKSGARYVLLGSTTILEENVSTDGKFIDTETGEILVNFNQFGESKGDVINHVNLFASQIAYTVFGYTIGSFQTGQAGVNAKATKPAIDMWKSRSLNYEAVSMDIADIDGDGKNETILIDKSDLYVYRYLNGVFSEVAKIKVETNTKLVSVGAVDLNSNGSSEIFVTGQGHTSYLGKAFIYEWNGTGLEKINEINGAYYRVIKTSDNGEKILLTQNSGKVIGGKVDSFRGKVYRVFYENGKYTRGESIDIPNNANVFSFTLGDVKNSGFHMLFGYDTMEYLYVSEGGKKPVWKSGEQYGGNTNFLSFAGDTTNLATAADRRYMPQKLFVVDLDGDDEYEMITVKNKDSAGRNLSRYRKFKSGEIEVMKWNITGPMTTWKTQKINGFISDFNVADMNNDGRDELVYCVVTKSGKNKTNLFFQEPLVDAFKK